jgi:hypothetical protein
MRMENVKALEELASTFHAILRILVSYDGTGLKAVPQDIQDRVLGFKKSARSYMKFKVA